ncbi:MAG TPA: hypothetical protein DDZ65_09095, partial [Firmicutes bacterium]|nr:hypothetical protein [Bacillota bacterium]
MNAEMDAAELVRDEQNKDEMFRSALERIIQLYTDKAHFIYELLQNAEDAQATTVKFHQMNDCLEVYHDGMPFSLKNLKSLCNIGASDKLGNLNQIGEFGVGFKSVFGICKKVRLYSMPRSCYDAHEALPAFGVEIINFTEPWKTSLEPIPEPYTTKFVFPYCVGESFSGFKTIDVLKRAIAKRLSNLGVTTLLFMRYLRSIEYEINCEGTAGSGRYMLNKKEIKPLYSIVTAMGATIGAKEELSYLKYSKTIPTMMGRTVDIAYPVIIVKDGRYRFQKAKNPPISVYFPTETKSEISLIVQGPYRTTPNRESIPFADEENIMLAELTADLLYESVLDIKAQGQMSLELLNILPLQEPENLDNWLFQPLYEKMIELFQTEAILPTAEEGFVTREHAKLVRGQELIGIFPGGLLGELINDQDYSFDEDENDDIAEEEDHVSYIPYKWLPGELTENNKELSALYSFLKDKLGIEVIKAEDLRKYLNYNRNFLKDRDDAWLEQFYKYLEKVPSLVNRSDAGRNMLSIPFVKTADEDFVVPFRKSGNGLLPNVFMPIKNIGEGFQFVHPLFAEQCNRFFTVILELREPDQYICFKKEIERRYATGLPKATDEEYIDDVKSVLKYLATSEYTGDLLRTLSKLFFIRCEGKVYVNPNNTDVYFDKSNEGVSTKDYFASGDSVRFVDMVFYADNGINRQILQLFGVKDTLIEDWDIESWYCSGEGNTQWCDADDFRSQLDFAGVDSAITLIQNNPKSDLAKKKSKIIMQLLLAVEKHLLGEIIQGKVAQKRVEAQAKIIDVLTCGRRRYYVPKPKWLF